MKRWTPKAIKLLEEQSRQSRQGLLITPGNGFPRKPTTDPLASLLGQSISQRHRRDILSRLLQGKPVTLTFHQTANDRV